MKKGPSDYIKPEVELIFKKLDSYQEENIKENKPKLDLFVSKLSNSSSVQILQKDYIKNKEESVDEVKDKNSN